MYPLTDNDMRLNQYFWPVPKKTAFVGFGRNCLKTEWKTFGKVINFDGGQSFNLFSFLPFKVQFKSGKAGKCWKSRNLMLPKSFWQIFHPPPKYVTDAKLDASWAQHCKIFFWKLGSMHSSTPPSLIKGCAISYLMHNHIIIAASCLPRGQSGNMQIFSLTSSPLVIHQHPFGFLSFVTPIDRSIL